ncbi:protein SOB FIVE-LIKE 3-like [Hevea brasiliensis]|nr:protein SOB FIVE-LIKE 3-like [Hevea brasiliensis]
MDSSKYNLATEGCSSSESGWTIYIASPMQEDDSECSDNDNDHNTTANDGNADDDDKQDSDDSMASDASSSPHHLCKPENGRQANHGTTGFKHDKGNNFKHCSPATKSNRKDKKNDVNSTEKDRRHSANRKYSKRKKREERSAQKANGNMACADIGVSRI